MITWISAATPTYTGDLSRLVASSRHLLPCQRILVQTCAGPWVHTLKHQIMRRLLPIVQTPYVCWIDADCEFLGPLTGKELFAGKPLMGVRHLLASLGNLPERFLNRITWDRGEIYWQTCVFGGTVERVAAMLDDLQWMDREGETYDEWGITLYLDQHRVDVNTLPTAYASPGSFAAWSAWYRESYDSRNGGLEPKIIHHNRASYATH